MSRAELYEAMTPTRLKTLLTAKGVSVKPKATHPELVKLAVEHQL